jgi:hypothetical protein
MTTALTTHNGHTVAANGRPKPPHNGASSTFRVRDTPSISTEVARSVGRSTWTMPSGQADARFSSLPRPAVPANVRTTPEDGDIVIREEQRAGVCVYVLHTAPRADQAEFLRREQAIVQAVALARRQDVRAWLTDEGYDFVLLESFRLSGADPQ